MARRCRALAETRAPKARAADAAVLVAVQAQQVAPQAVEDVAELAVVAEEAQPQPIS
jgi:hypothetical protein